MIKNTKKLLRHLGLSEKETDVLYILLQQDSLRVRDLARKAHLNRTTVYGIIKELMKKGLATSLSRYGVTEYQSIEPALLPTYLERKEEELKQHKKEIKTLVPQLQKLREEKNNLPQIYFFEGVEGLKQAYEDTLENNQEKVIRDFTGPDAMFEVMDEKKFVSYYVNKRVRLGIRSLTIFPNTKWSRFMKQNDAKENRETKLIPAEYAFNTGITIYDNRVGFFSCSPERPLAVIVEDANISKTMKKIFSYISDQAK